MAGAMPLPTWQEEDRLAALRRYAILDTPPEQAYDEVTAMLMALFDAPMSAVTLVDEARQWFKSQVGLGAPETPIDTSICKQAILQGGSLVVPDTLDNPQFACNPLVTGAPGIRFYAGEVLASDDGYPIGMLCVLDNKPRPDGITPQQQAMLKTLARLVMGQLELRRVAAEQAVLLVRQQDVEAALRVEQAQSARLNQTLEQQVAQRTGERDLIWRATRELIVVIGAGGVCRQVNPAWAAEFGPLPQGGARFIEFVHGDDRAPVERCLAQLAASVASLASVDLEARMRRADGAYRTVHWVLAGAGDGMFASGRDVTGQRALEEQLRQSQKMEAIGQLTGGIAHDFNNLLQGISSALEVMTRRVEGQRYDDLPRFINSAMGSTRRAGALTQRLLAFARRQPLEPQLVLVNALVLSMEELLHRTLGAKITLVLDLGETPWPLLCDANQLENALLNLCINARDAMPDGGRLTVSTSNVALDDVYAASLRGLQPGQYVCISVGDTGCGMAPATVARAFEPFFTTKAVGQGTGLGLAMIWGFAQQSEGHASIASVLGEGSTISLYLPRQQGAPAP